MLSYIICSVCVFCKLSFVLSLSNNDNTSMCEIVQDRMRETKRDRDIYREIVERYVQNMVLVDRIVYKYAIRYCLLIVALYPPVVCYER
jgi:hypothetical protein